jgi:hypothetical protein
MRKFIRKSEVKPAVEENLFSFDGEQKNRIGISIAPLACILRRGKVARCIAFELPLVGTNPLTIFAGVNRCGIKRQQLSEASDVQVERLRIA